MAKLPLILEANAMKAFSNYSGIVADDLYLSTANMENFAKIDARHEKT